MNEAQFKIERSIVLDIHKCSKCAHWWALEVGYYGGECPWCAHSLILNAQEATATARRAAASLRGLLAKRKAKP